MTTKEMLAQLRTEESAFIQACITDIEGQGVSIGDWLEVEGRSDWHKFFSCVAYLHGKKFRLQVMQAHSWDKEPIGMDTARFVAVPWDVPSVMANVCYYIDYPENKQKARFTFLDVALGLAELNTDGRLRW